MVSRKTCFFFSIVLSLLISTDLTAKATRRSTSSGVTSWKEGNAYLFTASYKLHTPTEPSDLQVDVLIEYNMSNSSCHNSSWFPFMRSLELKCVLDGEQKILRIWPIKGKGYEIGRLDTIDSSIWYHALEKLADHIGKQYYGGYRQPAQPLLNISNTPTSSLIDIRPIRNHKLQNMYGLIAPPKMRYPRDANICVQEELYRGKKLITASVIFPKNKRMDKSISMKFIHTSRGLQDISKKSMRNFALYSSAKKAVGESIARYIRLKKYHGTASRVVAPVKDVDPALQKIQKPQQKPQNMNNSFFHVMA
jgi:hypothetical protein